MEKNNEKSELDHHDKMRDMEKNFIKQADNIDSIQKTKIEKYLKNASSIAQKDVLENEEKTEDYNKYLKSEIKNFQKEIQNLKALKNQVQTENKIFTRNLSLAEEGGEQYNIVNNGEMKKIKKLKDKIDFLKNFISQEVIKYTKEIELTKFRHSNIVNSYEAQMKILKEFLINQNEELKNVRRISKKITEQRTDIEEYFLDTIDQVQVAIKKDKSNLKVDKSGLANNNKTLTDNETSKPNITDKYNIFTICLFF